MNRFPAKQAGFALLVLVLSVSMFITGCAKNQECKASVTCLTSTGSPMAGVEVKLEHGDVKMTATTDGSGTANFESELPMILDILVNGSPTGRVARMEEGKTDNVTVQ
jgi:hypothetical protein